MIDRWQCEHKWAPLVSTEYVCEKCRLRVTFFDIVKYGLDPKKDLSFKGKPPWMSKESSET